jgi:hypothetical protein
MMLRTQGLFALLALLAGCSSEGMGSRTGASGDGQEGDPGAAEVSQVEQRAQFADDTIINLVDPLTATITVTADVQPVDIQIFYVSDKTTNTTHTPGPAVLVDTIALGTDQTKQHTVNLLNPAFAGGYGSILLSSVVQSPNKIFQTYVEYGGSVFSTGGSVFMGGSYRIPYRSGTVRMVLALTNQSNFAFNFTILNVGNQSQFRTINLSPLSTYKFDSLANGWVLNGTSSIQVSTTNGGTVALSGYIDRLLQRNRITPVKAAPFF